MATPYTLKYYSALIDIPTGAVLTVGTFPAAMVFLKECTTDSWVANSVNDPNYIGWLVPTPFFLSSVKPEDYPKWTWDYKTRKFLKTKKDLIDERLIARSALANEKRNIITKMMTSLSLARSGLMTGVSFQEHLYAIKKAQAAAFKNSGYDEDTIMSAPYVLQYADFANISLRQAADDILLKAKFDEEFLMKTEFLRLKYFKAVKSADDPSMLPAIYEEFIRIAYLNSKI